MPLLARVMFALVNFAARKGLAEDAARRESAKAQSRRTGIRGETFAYWYLRRQGYVLIARNYKSSSVKGELDLVGFDQEILAFIEVKTRTMADRDSSAPEDAITSDKRRHLARIAHQFLRERRLDGVPYRFDVLAIQCPKGKSPAVRLHKNVFAPGSV